MQDPGGRGLAHRIFIGKGAASGCPFHRMNNNIVEGTKSLLDIGRRMFRNQRPIVEKTSPKASRPSPADAKEFTMLASDEAFAQSFAPQSERNGMNWEGHEPLMDGMFRHSIVTEVKWKSGFEKKRKPRLNAIYKDGQKPGEAFDVASSEGGFVPLEMPLQSIILPAIQTPQNKVPVYPVPDARRAPQDSRAPQKMPSRVHKKALYRRPDSHKKAMPRTAIIPEAPRPLEKHQSRGNPVPVEKPLEQASPARIPGQPASTKQRKRRVPPSPRFASIIRKRRAVQKRWKPAPGLSRARKIKNKMVKSRARIDALLRRLKRRLKRLSKKKPDEKKIAKKRLDEKKKLDEKNLEKKKRRIPRQREKSQRLERIADKEKRRRKAALGTSRAKGRKKERHNLILIKRFRKKRKKKGRLNRRASGR
jgi:hypothetical protein